MSEFIGTRCDGCGKLIDVEPIDVVDSMAWEEDDYGNHKCSDCQKKERALEVDNEGLVALVDGLTAASEAILESPEVLRLKAERLAAFKKIKKQAVQEVWIAMRQAGASEEQIEQEIEDLDCELEERFKLSYTYETFKPPKET